MSNEVKTNYEKDVEVGIKENEELVLAGELLNDACKICGTTVNELFNDEVDLNLYRFKRENNLNIEVVSSPIFLISKITNRIIKEKNFLTWLTNFIRFKWFCKLLDKRILVVANKSKAFETQDELIKFLKNKNEKIYVYRIFKFKDQKEFYLRYNTLTEALKDDKRRDVVRYADKLIDEEKEVNKIEEELQDDLEIFYDCSCWDYKWPDNIKQILEEDKKLLGDIQFAILKRYINITGSDWVKLPLNKKKQIIKKYIKLENKFKKQVMKEVKFVNQANELLGSE